MKAIKLIWGRHMRRVPAVFLVLLTITACATIHSGEHAVIRLRNNWTFPFVFLDFGSTALCIEELDGEKVLKFGWVQLSPGKHGLEVGVTKGPTGLFGSSPSPGYVQRYV